MVPVIVNAGSLSFEEFLAAYDALVEKARTNALTADDLVGANVTLTNPGGLGTVASVPRLMPGQGTIVATGSIGYPVGLGNIGEMIGAEKVMTMTSTYDHRVIQGAESGRFLAQIEQYLQGENGFYEERVRVVGRGAGTSAAAAGARSRRICRGRSGRAGSGRGAVHGRGRDPAGGAGGEHVREPRAQPRAPGRAPRPAGLRARGRPGPGPGGAGTDPGDPGAPAGDGSSRCTCPARRWPTRCRTCARPTAARSRMRSSTSPRTASACGCASTSSRARSVTS